MSAWKNPTPVAVGVLGVLPLNDRSIGTFIGVRRAIPPIGGLAFPGGYVDEGESAEIAITRELHEEVGIATRPELWTPFVTKISPARNLLIIFLQYEELLTVAQADSFIRSFKPNREVSQLELITHGSKLCFDLHQDVLQQLQH